MKSKLLVSALGITLLGTSALALADNDRRHDRNHRPSDYQHRSFGPKHFGPHAQPQFRHEHRNPHWAWHHRHDHGWHAPYYRHYSYAPRYYGGYDDGVTIIFKGRLD